MLNSDLTIQLASDTDNKVNGKFMVSEDENMGDSPATATIETIAASQKATETMQNATAQAMLALATTQSTMSTSLAVLTTQMAQAQKDAERLERQTDEYRRRAEQQNGEYRESIQTMFASYAANSKEQDKKIEAHAAQLARLQTKSDMSGWLLGLAITTGIGSLATLIIALIRHSLGF